MPIAKQAPRRAKLPAAAERYGVSVKTLRRRIASGELTAHRLGARIILVDLDELEGLLSPMPSAPPGKARQDQQHPPANRRGDTPGGAS